ncbi:hypothetical protein BWD42_13945 [Sphingobacterium sp. CZ-UAM]|nr:hypothetical protein BWD42_24235 [Sphingobacterium sp. CZ-UAM]OOG16180.1 hypothetical protein BWD42_20765 [Sphingobacterium sp. CZ-UAM]OOG18349.1 hypothetical protein BWD42_13945 [Sphingobacterium sp. CZ-UAM]
MPPEQAAMKKERFKRAWQDLKSRSAYFKRGNQKREKEKKTSKVFWKFKKDFYLCSPNGNGGKQKKIKRDAMSIGIKRIRKLKRKKFFKKTQSCSVTSRQTKVMNKFKN